jgi:hypothetical protein
MRDDDAGTSPGDLSGPDQMKLARRTAGALRSVRPSAGVRCPACSEIQDVSRSLSPGCVSAAASAPAGSSITACARSAPATRHGRSA